MTFYIWMKWLMNYEQLCEEIKAYDFFIFKRKASEIERTSDGEMSNAQNKFYIYFFIGWIDNTYRRFCFCSTFFCDELKRPLKDQINSEKKRSQQTASQIVF